MRSYGNLFQLVDEEVAGDGDDQLGEVVVDAGRTV
jgi:hypothetical protein